MLAKENIQDIFAMAPIQEAIYFHSRYDQDSLTYFEQVSFQQHGQLNVSCMEKSFNELLKRHDVLRSVFVQKTTDKPLQVILKERPVDFYFSDISNTPFVEEAINNYKAMDRGRSFHLDKDVLMRIAVLQTGELSYELIWSWHHIILDAWCISILQKEFIEIYNSFLENRLYALPEIKPYSDYLHWLDKQDWAASEGYWKNYLFNYTEATVIPQIRKESAGQQVIGKAEVFFSKDQTAALTRLAADLRVTLNNLLQTIWGILLSKYNQQTDVVFGTVVSGRPPDLAGVESMIGLFINTIPVRITYDQQTTFSALVKAVQANAMEGREHHYCSLATTFMNTPLKSALFDHLFLFQNFPGSVNESSPSTPVASGEGLNLKMTGAFESFYYDFNVFAFAGSRLSIVVKFNKHSYDVQFVNDILNHYQYIALQVIDNSAVVVDAISLLSAGAQEKLLSDAAPVAGDYLTSQTIIQLFEQQVHLYPEETALRYKNVNTSFEELNAKANALAHRLNNTLGIVNGDVVAVMTDRSDKMIVALLGILKAGAAFLPLEPGFLPERKHYILSDAKVKLLITESAYIHDVSAYYEGPLFAIDIELSDTILTNPPLQATTADLAYILYTSGSTGRPKGVDISVRSLSNYIQWANEFYFNNTRTTPFALFTPLTFDLTLTSIFSPLLRGDMICIADSNDTNQVLEEIFTGGEVKAVKLTPSHITMLHYLALEKTGVEIVIAGGEELTREQIQVLRKLNDNIKIFNEYGPTEATVGCIVKEIEKNEEPVTIGKPIANAYAYILNDKMEMQPDSITGEIWIGGTSLANGYTGNPGMTAGRFVPDPFKPHERIYRTGDMGRRLANGEIAYLGRKDDQLKIRGFRIEPGEIEKRLKEIPAVTEALVVAKEDHQQIKFLVAYLVATVPVDQFAVKQQLFKQLPEYMVPSCYVQLERFPLSGNGKIDKKNLPEPFTAATDRQVAAPRNKTEQELVEIWQEILARENISIHDSFFDIGGHSLNAVQVVSRVYKRFNKKIELKDVFDLETVAGLAKHITSSESTIFQEIMPVEKALFYDISHAQKRLWIIDQMSASKHAYNISQSYIFKDLSVEAFEKAMMSLVERHENLRTTFHYIDQVPKQKVHPFSPGFFSIEHKDLRQEVNRYEIAKIWAEQDAVTPFDLSTGPMLRMKLLQVENDTHICLFILHHIISDGWSTIVLLDEFFILYNAYVKGAPDPLPALRIHYKDFAVWQNERISKEAETYWLETLAERPELIKLPFNNVQGEMEYAAGEVHYFRVDNRLTDAIKKLAKDCNTTLSNVLLSVYFLLLKQISDQEHLCIGIGHANRDHPDVENLIGFFVNLLVIDVRFQDDLTIEELIKQVTEKTVGAFKHAYYPFELLVEKICKDRYAINNPLVNVTYSFQNFQGIDTGLHKQTEAGENALNSGFYQYGNHSKTSKSDLHLSISEINDGLLLHFEYNSLLLGKETIEYFEKIMKGLLKAVGGVEVSSINPTHYEII